MKKYLQRNKYELIILVGLLFLSPYMWQVMQNLYVVEFFPDFGYWGNFKLFALFLVITYGFYGLYMEDNTSPYQKK